MSLQVETMAAWFASTVATMLAMSIPVEATHATFGAASHCSLVGSSITRSSL